MKGKFIMKKYFLTLVMLFTMSVCSFAEDTEMENLERYELKVDMRKLSVFLNLNNDQIDGVEAVETELYNDLMFVAVSGSNDTRERLTANTIKKHVSHMRYVLNEEQYKKYLMVFNATMKNRGIVK